MENRNRRVEIRSLNKNKFGGLSLYPYSSGTVLVPQLTKAGFKTGLTKEEETLFEEALNLKKGELSRKSEFWSGIESELRIKNKAILDLNLDSDFLKYRWILENSKVCPATKDLSKYPNAEFVIVDEESEAAEDAKQINWEIKAFESFVELTEADKKGVLKIYGVKADSASIDMVNSKLHKFLKLDPKRFVQTIEDKNLKTKVLIEELLEYSIITKSKNFYKNGDDIIGASTDEVLEYLNNPKNSSLLANFKSRLEKAKK